MFLTCLVQFLKQKMKIIKPIPLEYVEYDFLKAEWYKSFFNPVRGKFKHLIENPDFSNSEHNRLRRELLWAWRRPLLQRLPNNISWFLASLDEGDFSELFIIREIGWETTFGNTKKLKDVATAILDGIEDKGVGFDLIEAIKKQIGVQPFREKLLVISTNLQGPYTVVEGNHRAVAFHKQLIETNNASHLPKEVYLGTSSLMHISPWLNFN